MPLNRFRRSRLERIKKNIADFLYGMFYHQLYLDSKRFSSSFRDFILFVMYSDIIGIPLFTNVLTLRLLPYMLGELYEWRVRVLREKDITDVVPEAS